MTLNAILTISPLLPVSNVSPPGERLLGQALKLENVVEGVRAHLAQLVHWPPGLVHVARVAAGSLDDVLDEL